MSSYFDDASLVMIPSGYKTSKVYSVKPTDGSGDLTFSRSNDTATRVNSAGLIEKVRTNLLTYSNTFSNAAWTVVGTPTLTANYATNPLTGANDAWRFVSAGTGDRLVQAFSGSFHNFSLYAKGTGIIRLRDSTDTYGINVTLTSSWQRISVHISAAFTNVQFLGGSGGCDATIYAAQLETGDIATDYIATTSSAVSVGPVANVPRLDYLGSSCPRLLLEPQRTNLLTYSEQLNLWNGANVTITSNTSQSPDGYQNADNVNITGTNGYWRSSGLTFANSTSYAASVFVKKSATTGTKTFRFYYNNNVGAPNDGEWNCVVDLTNITATTTPSGTAVTGRPTILSTNLVDYGNDWYRVEVAFTTGSGAGNSSSEVGFQTNGVVVVDFDAYGAQLEAGSYATSYIPTLGAAVTRGADAAVKTGISSLIGQTEGAMFIDVNLDTRQSFTYFTIAPNVTSAANYLGFYITNTLIGFEAVVSGVLQAQINLSNSATGRFKLAAAYKANDFVLYVNGVQVGTDTSGSVPTCSQIGLYQYNQTQPLKYNQALLFKTRLSNADLAALTTI